MRNVEPSTEKGRDELFSVTVGGGPPRSPADAQTDAPEEVDVAAAWVEVVAVVEVVDSVFVVSEGAPQSFSEELLSDWVDCVGLPAAATLDQYNNFIREGYAALISSSVTSGTRRF